MNHFSTFRRGRFSLHLLAVMLVTGIFVPYARSQNTERVLAVVGGTLVDGTGAAAKPNMTVIVRAGRITQIGPSGTTHVPDEAQVINAAGKYILPGFIDAHIHYRDYYPELLITYGVTSCEDWGGSPTDWEFAQRDGINAGKIYGPRIYTSGEIIGGGRDGSTAAAVRHVDQMAERGANKIDIGLNISVETAAAVIAEAHKLGLPITGYPYHAREAIEAGIDAIKHDYTVGEAAQTDPAKLQAIYKQVEDRNSEPDARLWLLGDNYKDLAKLMVEHKTVWVPTMIKDFKLYNDRRDEFEIDNYRLLSNPELQYLPVADLLVQIPNNYPSGIPYVASGFVGTMARSGPDYELYSKTYRNLEGLVKTIVQMGGHVLAGTAPHSFVLPGLSLHQEMELFVDAGLTPMQALQSASLWVAESLRVQKDVGSVEVGKFGDIVLLKKNPLDDIRNSRTVDTVIQGGRVLPTGYHHDYRNPIPRASEMAPPGEGAGRPQVGMISPTTATQNSDGIVLDIKGRNFGATASVTFDKLPLPTQYVSSTELKATIPQDMLAQVGNYEVEVWNPHPGGGTSQPVSFIVKYK